MLRAVQIAAQKVVSIEYTLTSDTGEVIDTSQGRAPLAYLHGAGNIVPGLEKALDGKVAGDSLEVSVPPEEGYGVRDDRLVQNVPVRKLPQGKAQVGQRLRADTEHGPRILTVVAVKGDYAKVDANHPLASKTLHFKVKVVEVRDATAQELEHGHVHAHGHDH
jgi:FKBP-type peptidyl-prolyl cis-trans isomerase SlyD